MEFLKSFIEGPLPNILVVGGLLFLLLSVVGKLGALIIPDPKRQKVAAFIGVLLLVAGIGLHFVPVESVVPREPEKQKQKTSEVIQPIEFDVEARIKEVEKHIRSNEQQQSKARAAIGHLQPLLHTDPDAQKALDEQERWLSKLREERSQLQKEIEDLRNKTK